MLKRTSLWCCLLLLLFSPARAELTPEVYGRQLVELARSEDYDGLIKLVTDNPQMSSVMYCGLMMQKDKPELQPVADHLLNLMARIFQTRLGVTDFSDDLRAKQLLEDESTWRSTPLAAVSPAAAPPGVRLVTPQLFERVMTIASTMELEGNLAKLALDLGNYQMVHRICGLMLAALDDLEVMLEVEMFKDLPELQGLRPYRRLAEALDLAALERMGLNTVVLEHGPTLYDALDTVTLSELPTSDLKILTAMSVAQAARRSGRPNLAREWLLKCRQTDHPDVQHFVDSLLFEQQLEREPGLGLEQQLEAHKQIWAQLAAHHLDSSYGNDGLRFWVRHLAELGQKYQADPARAQRLRQLLEGDLAFIAGQVTPQQRALDFHPPEGSEAAEAVGFFDLRIAEANLGYALGLPEVYLDLAAASDAGASRRVLQEVLPEIERNEAILAVIDDELARRGRSESFTEGGLVQRVRGRYYEESAHQLEKSGAPAAEVLDQLAKASDLYARGGDETLSLGLASRLGRALFATGQTELALQTLDSAIERCQSIGYRSGEVNALIERARIRKAQNQTEPAGSDAQRAIVLLEQELDQLGGGQAGAEGLREQARLAYSLVGELQIQAGQTEQALETLTKERQFQTVTTLGAQVQSQDQTTQKALTAYRSQQQRTQALQLEAQTLKSLPAEQRNPDQLKKVEALLADSKATFLQTTRELRSANPKVFDATLSLKPIEFGRLQHSIPPEAAVVQYFPTEDTLYFFVVTSEEFRLRSLKVGKADLDESIQTVRRGLVDPRSAPPAALKTLYTQLIAPVEADLAGKKVLAIVPTLRLHYLPFAALQAPDGQYLVEKHQLVVLSKASDLTNLASAHPKTGKFAGFGNPDGTLPAAGEEVKALQKLFPDGQAYVGGEATKEHLVASAPGAGYLHLATHGRLSPRDPNQSYLVMGNKGELTPSEIFELQLDQASMVTLSACETGLGESDPQSSITSLAEAFWAAGPPTVVASLWKVADNSTRDLMVEFYGQLKNGANKSAALQTAQLKLLKDPKTASPFYWAPFVILGAWK